LVSDIPAGDVKIANLFYSVCFCMGDVAPGMHRINLHGDIRCDGDSVTRLFYKESFLKNQFPFDLSHFRFLDFVPAMFETVTACHHL
jgi:hypothetical protein